MANRDPHRFDDEDDRLLKAVFLGPSVEDEASAQKVYLSEPDPEVEFATILGAPPVYRFVKFVGASLTYPYDLDVVSLGRWQTDEPLGITTSGVMIMPDPTTQEGPKPPAIADRDWFYSDPALVEKYAGHYVSVLNREVVGSGTPQEAYDGAIAAGAEKPLVFKVPTEEDLESAELGL